MPLDLTPSDEDVLYALLRSDLTSFVHKAFTTVVPGETYFTNWHIQHIAWQLERVVRGEIKRLMILLPPRSLKSVITSVAYPAWVLGHDPGAKIICVSYAESLARKHALDCRSVVQADWYKKVFGGTRIDPGKNTELEFLTTRRGYRLATSVGGTLTGRGGNLIIIDDPMKPEEAMSESGRTTVNQWYTNTLLSRLNNKAEDAIVLVMQRLHQNDLAGHILENEDWTVVTIPAIADAEERYELAPRGIYMRRPGEVIDPRRETTEILEGLKAQMGTQAFSAQYQQSPVPAGGAIFQWDWFQRFDLQPGYQEGDRFVHSWDTASKTGELNDYSVGSVWLRRKTEVYLLDVIRERLVFPDLVRRVIEVANTPRYKADDILIEDQGSGTNLIQELKQKRIHSIAIQPKGEKEMRAWAVTPTLEGKKVFIPQQAPWLDDFQREIMQFPQSRFDDQIDAMAQFLTWWVHGKKRVFGVAKIGG